MAQFESDLDRSFRRQMETANRQLGNTSYKRPSYPANTGVSNSTVISSNTQFPSSLEQPRLGRYAPNTGVSNSPEVFKDVQYTEAGTPEQRQAGGFGGVQGAAAGNLSGVAAPESLSIDPRINVNDDGPDNYLNPHKEGNLFGPAPRDTTSFESLAAGRPDSPGQQGMRLGSSIGGVPEDAYNVIGKQDDSNNIVTQRYAAALADLRARSNSQGSQEASSIPEREGPDPYEIEVRNKQRNYSMRRELGNIEDALKSGKISAKDAFSAMNQVRSRYGDEGIARDKLGEEAYKTDAGIYSDEATRRNNLDIAREKLAYDRQSDLLDRMAAQDKSSYDRYKDERDFNLSLGKYDLSEREFAGLQAHRATQAQEAEQKLGTQSGQLIVAAENAQTNASQEIRNMWKDVFEGSIPKAAAVKASIEKYGVDRAIQFDPEALAVIQDYQANPTPENKAKGDEMLKKLGYYAEE